jgi:hypothetical protein
MFKSSRLAAPIAVAVLLASLVLGAGSASAATLRSFGTHPTPKISLTPKIGVKLGFTRGTWKPSGTTFSYQWRLSGHSIVGATGTTYTPVLADYGKRLTVSVTATKHGYRTLRKLSASSRKVVFATYMTRAGLYPVGSKVTPGTYVARHASASCYWQRVGTTPNVFGSIIGQEYLKGQAVATIQPTDTAFKTGGCGAWMKLSDVQPRLLATIPTTGDYLVGAQLVAGATYTATTPGAGCNWSTVRSFSGVYDSDVIEHGDTSAPLSVVIPTDALGFLVDNCGTWTKTADPPAAPAAG